MKGGSRGKIAVLASGRGSNFIAIADAIEKGKINAVISVLVSDNPGARAVAAAEARGIETKVVDPGGISRDEFDGKVVEILRGFGVDLVVLAGFMRIVGKPLIEAFPQRIMNIHPSLLPSFKGLHAQRQALEYGVKVSGCTVHFVDEGVDTGPIILQKAVPVLDDDTVESLSKRILAEEHRIYPEAVRLFMEGRLRLSGRRVFIEGEGAP